VLTIYWNQINPEIGKKKSFVKNGIGIANDTLAIELNWN